MKVAITIRTLIYTVLVGFSLGVQAEGYFVSGDFDVNKFPNWSDVADNADYGQGAASSSTSQSTVSFGLGINVGQWVNQIFGWEIGYNDFGSVTGYTTACCNSYGSVVGNSYKYTATASHAEVLVGSSSGLFGKVGLYSASTQLTIPTLTIFQLRNSGIYFGIGGRYFSDDSEHFAFRLGIDVYPKVKFTDISDFTRTTSETITQIYFGEDYIF